VAAFGGQITKSYRSASSFQKNIHNQQKQIRNKTTREIYPIAIDDPLKYASLSIEDGLVLMMDSIISNMVLFYLLDFDVLKINLIWL
jgi:hypothetical protein